VKIRAGDLENRQTPTTPSSAMSRLSSPDYAVSARNTSRPEAHLKAMMPQRATPGIGDPWDAYRLKPSSGSTPVPELA